VGTLGKSFTLSVACVALRRETSTQYPRCVGSASISSRPSGLEEAQ